MLYMLMKLTIVSWSSLLVKEVKGLENLPKKGGYVLPANHSSYLDPVVVPSIFIKHFKTKVHYLAKKELFKPWLLGKSLKAAGIIPIDKTGKDKGALKSALSALKKGEIIGIFPEGGRSRTGKLQKGKTGVARLALWGRVPVVPIGIKGSYEIWPANKKIFKFKKGIEVNIGKPMYFDRYYNKKTTKKLLIDITRQVMRQVAKLSSQKYRF